MLPLAPHLLTTANPSTIAFCRHVPRFTRLAIHCTQHAAAPLVLFLAASVMVCAIKLRLMDAEFHPRHRTKEASFLAVLYSLPDFTEQITGISSRLLFGSSPIARSNGDSIDLQKRMLAV